MRLRDEQASASADHAVPRDALAVGARSHGIANGAGASGKAQGAGQFAIGGDLAARNLLDQAIDRLPGHREKLYRRGAEERRENLRRDVPVPQRLLQKLD